MVYDVEGRISKIRAEDAKGEVLRRFVLTRNEQGRLMKDELLLGGRHWLGICRSSAPEAR
jgi:hypothetical protein